MHILCDTVAFGFLCKPLNSISGAIVHHSDEGCAYHAAFGIIPESICDAVCIVMPDENSIEEVLAFGVHRVAFCEDGFVFFENTLLAQRDVSFVVQGRKEHDAYLTGLCLFYLWGNVISATWDDLGTFDQVRKHVHEHDVFNAYNIYYQCVSTIAGLQKCQTPFAVKVRADEYYADWGLFLDTLRANPDKIVCNNVYFYPARRKIFHAGDHVIAAKTMTLRSMFEEAKARADSRDIPYYITHAEQMLTYSLLCTRYPETTLQTTRNGTRRFMHEEYCVVHVDTFGDYCIRTTLKGVKHSVVPARIATYGFMVAVGNINEV